MDPQEKVNRPPSDAFRQQRLKAWQPIMTPLKVVLIFFVIGISFIPTGNYLLGESNDIYEDTLIYDGDDVDVDCSISTSNEGRSCSLTFTIDEDVSGPIYVYYEFQNFYQNHRRYVSSVDYYQMSGEDIAESDLDSSCVELIKNGSQLLNPCGLIANSYFTDLISLNSAGSSPANSFTLDESDIAWESDKDKFKQPSGFASVKVDNSSVTCADAGLPTSCSQYYDSSETQYYLYYYPKDSSTQYLYETYPAQISPIKGVTDDHFKVWMRTAALPTFRKMYGKISDDLKKGNTLTFNIIANYEVGSYDATKGLVITNLGEYGAKNPYLGVAYIVVGSISLFFAMLFAMKQLLAPRPPADPTMLDWKN